MPSLSSPTQSTDTIYPEPISWLHRRIVPKKRKGGSSRYRTQPVTFSEIQEVDEDNIEEPNQPSEASCSKSEWSLLNEKFEAFKKTLESNKAEINKNLDNADEIAIGLPRSSVGKLTSRPSF